ncbi:MAG: hypothetical protein IKF51_05390 [Solobacterium sp.]|nr:hypothetical protein [Solobacterium sp.]
MEVTVRELYEMTCSGSALERDQAEYVFLQGWIRECGDGFVAFNDGTYFRHARIITEEAGRFAEGSAVAVTGRYTETPGGVSPFEIRATEIVCEGGSAPDYPEVLAKDHMRVRTYRYAALFRVRSALSMAVHEFFQDQGFVCLNLPYADSDDIYTAAYAAAFRDVYTFGPQKSGEQELWYITSRLAFAEPEDVLSLMEDFCRGCAEYLLENCGEEMNYFASLTAGLRERLETLLGEYDRGLSVSAGEPSVPYFVMDEKKGTVDLYIPGFGRLCTGTPDDPETSKEEVREDLRLYGGMESGGFRMPLEDYVMMVTGMTSLSEVIPFPAGQKRE